MFTDKQVKRIGHGYVYGLYRLCAKYMGEEEIGEDSLVNGQCYFYAEALADILQGKWKNVDVNTLSEEEKKQRWEEIGKIVTYTGDHYLVQYGELDYDGLGCHSSNNNGRYLELDKIAEGNSTFCRESWKQAIWDIYKIGYKAVEEDFLKELYEIAGDDSKDIDTILAKYLDKSITAIGKEALLYKKEDGTMVVGEAVKIKCEQFKRTPEEHLEIIENLEKMGFHQVLRYKPKKEDN